MRRLALAAGLAVFVAGLSPWVDSASEASLPWHMAQHLGLTMLAAPLLALGLEPGPLLRALPRGAGRRLVRLGHPLAAWTIFVGIQWTVHFTGVFEYAEEHPWAHAGEHAVFLASALLFWWPLLGRPTRLDGPAAALYVLLGMPAMGAVGVVLLTSDSPRYAGYSVVEQHAAGALMWVVSSLAMVAGLVLAVWGWLQREERRALAREAYGR